MAGQNSMDLWQLYILVSVIEQKSFSKASQTINLSQPTVSNHIKELEAYFGCRLLDRLGKTTEPTKAGRVLYRYAKDLLHLRDQAEAAVHNFLGNIEGSLSIGGSTIPSGYILPQLIGPFSKKFPDIHVRVTSGDTMQIIKKIKSGDLEFGFVGALVDDPLIAQEPFVSDQMKLIVPMNHRWADRTDIDCRHLFDEPFIAREKGSGTWKSILTSFKTAGYDPDRLNTYVTLGNTTSVIQGILNDAGISILSTIAVQDEIEKGRLCALEVNDLDLTRYFYLTTATKRTVSPISQKFIEFATEHFQ